MTKEELIDVLRATGIVAKENDANGLRILVTVNDLETLSEKAAEAKRIRRIQLIQTVVLVLTALCLVVTTIVGVYRPFIEEKVRYISRDRYILRIDSTGPCAIVESNHPGAIERHKALYAFPICDSVDQPKG